MLRPEISLRPRQHVATFLASRNVPNVILPQGEIEERSKKLAKPLPCTSEIANAILQGKAIDTLMYPGINLNVTDIEGNLLINHAIDSQNYPALMTLLEHGADPSPFVNINRIPFCNALDKRDFTAARILLASDKLDIYKDIPGRRPSNLIQELSEGCYDADEKLELERLWTTVEERIEKDINFQLNSDIDVQRLSKLLSALISSEKHDKVKELLKRIPLEAPINQVFTCGVLDYNFLFKLAQNIELVKFFEERGLRIEDCVLAKRDSRKNVSVDDKSEINSGIVAAIKVENIDLLARILNRNPEFIDNVDKITNIIYFAFCNTFSYPNSSTTNSTDYLLQRFRDQLTNDHFYGIFLNLLNQEFNYHNSDSLKSQLSLLKKLYKAINLQQLQPEQIKEIKLAIIQSRKFELLDELDIEISPAEKFYTDDKNGWTLTHFLFNQILERYPAEGIEEFEAGGFETAKGRRKEQSELTPTEKYFKKHFSQLDLHALTDDGDTLLHIAAQNRNFRVMRFLMIKGLDPALENKYGETPLDILPERLCNISELPEHYFYFLQFLTDFFSIETRK